MAGASEEKQCNEGSALAGLKRRRDRMRTWFCVFVVMMPVGCIGPCGLFFVVPKGGLVQTVVAIMGFALPFVGLGGMLLMLGDLSKTKRSLAVAEEGERMGLLFTEKPAKADYDWVRTLKMYSAADDRARAFNLLSGEISGFELTIMDYVYAVGMGKYSRAFGQTLLVMHDAAPGLPDFIVSPRSIWDTVSKLMGGRHVEFADQSSFAQRFMVQGDDPDAIRECFTMAAMDLCEHYKNQTVEVSGGRIATHRFNKRTDPNEYSDLVAHLGRLLKVFRGG